MCHFDCIKDKHWQYNKDVGDNICVLDCKLVHDFKEKHMQIMLEM